VGAVLIGLVILENVTAISLAATVVVSLCVIVTEVPTFAHSIVKPPIVAVHPLELIVKSLGTVIAILPLLALLGNVVTVVNFTTKLQLAPTISHPELFKLVFTKASGRIVIVFEKDPKPISVVEVLVVTVKLPPTFLSFCLILIVKLYVVAVDERQAELEQGLLTVIVVRYPPLCAYVQESEDEDGRI